MFVELPPLRMRDGDAQLLAEHFLDECASRFREPRKRLAKSTIAWIDGYDWPGNVRELENTIMRECLITDADVLVFPHAPSGAAPGDTALSYAEAKAIALAEFDRRFIRASLTRASGNVTRAAMDAQRSARLRPPRQEIRHQRARFPPLSRREVGGDPHPGRFRPAPPRNPRRFLSVPVCRSWYAPCL